MWASRHLVAFAVSWFLVVAHTCEAAPTSSDPCAPRLGLALQGNQTHLGGSVRKTVSNDHLTANRLKGRYEDPTIHGASHMAADPDAVRCSHSLLRGRQYCPQLNFTTSTLGHIYHHFASGHYSYEPDACVLRRLTGRESTACLGEVGPIILMGDSVTRYQFLTLVHFLVSGLYQNPFEGDKSLSEAHAHPVSPGANKYDKLWEYARDQVEKHTDDGFLYYNHDRDAHMEHAHLQLKLHGTKRTVDVYYVYVTRGSSMFREATEWALSKRTDWSHVILNACAHYDLVDGDYLKDNLANDVITFFKWAAKRLTGSASVQQHRRPTRLVWKSCTKESRAVDKAEKEIRQYCREANVSVYDVHGISGSAEKQNMVATWTASTVHFWQWVYEQFNDLLLNILCAP